MSEASFLEQIRERDRELVTVAKEIKLLTFLSWPNEQCERFLEGYRAGVVELPEIYDRCWVVNPGAIAALLRLSVPIADHPLARFVARTAKSYVLAARMLASVGDPAFSEISTELYGQPKDPVADGSLTNLEAAEHFIESSAELAAACPDSEDEEASAPADPLLEAEAAATYMRERLDAFFSDDKVSVVLDPDLASKAAAGATRVRLRGGTRFRVNELRLLIEHEAFVHTATALNGRYQPLLTCMSLSAPRTTPTQEGLATFAEFITCTMDLARLRRIALRVKAIDNALEGADFIDTFRFFLDHGQTPRESFLSAQRVFRGGDVRGKVAFTKDSAYLRGLLGVHTFLHAALAERKVAYPSLLFAGRMTCADVIELEPCFDAGHLIAPRYEPTWLAQRNNLAAYLAFSTLTHTLPLDKPSLASVVNP